MSTTKHFGKPIWRNKYQNLRKVTGRDRRNNCILEKQLTYTYVDENQKQKKWLGRTGKETQTRDHNSTQEGRF